MPNYGYDSYLGLKKESVWGVFEAPTAFVPLTTESLKGETAWVERASELRQSRFATTPIPGRKTVTGGFTFNAYPHNLGLVLATFFGDAQADTNPAPGVYTHSFIASTVNARQMSVEIGKGAQNPRQISGYRINELTLTQDNEKNLVIEVSGGGKDEIEGGSVTTAVYTETLPYMFYHATLTSGVDTIYSDNVSIKLNQTLKLDNFKVGGGQTTMEQIYKDRPTMGGTFVVDFENYDDYDKFMNFTDVDLTLSYINSEEVTPGNPYRLTVKLPKVRLKSNMPVAGSSALMTVSNEFEAYADTVDTYVTPVEAILTDGTAVW